MIRDEDHSLEGLMEYCGARWEKTMERPEGYWYSDELSDLRSLAYLLSGGVLASDREVQRIVQKYKKA